MQASIAVIADIHGNRWALEAVLRDIDQRGIEQIVNLGDHLAGPLDPAGTADLILSRPMITICGNDDRVLLAAPDELSPSQQWARDQLTATQLDWLRGLPATAVIGDDIYACHGDRFDTPYLLETVTPQGVVLRDAAAIAASVATITPPIIICGHSHLPRTVAVPPGKLIVNPGSVGLPAYTDTEPLPHAMESGSPHARYAVLTPGASAWQVDHIQLPYDWEHAAQVARDRQRPDWAQWLATGRSGL